MDRTSPPRLTLSLFARPAGISPIQWAVQERALQTSKDQVPRTIEVFVSRIPIAAFSPTEMRERDSYLLPANLVQLQYDPALLLSELRELRRALHSKESISSGTWLRILRSPTPRNPGRESGSNSISYSPQMSGNVLALGAKNVTAPLDVVQDLQTSLRLALTRTDFRRMRSRWG